MGAQGGDATPTELRVLGALVRVSAASTAAARRALGREVHSNLQISTVLRVADAPGLGPADLAGMAGVLLPSMSRVLRTLTDAGLVRTVADEADARYRHVFLTDEGRARVVRFRESAAAIFRATEVAEVAALMGVSSTGGDTPPFDLAFTRLAEEGTVFVREARMLLPDLKGLTNRALWPVVALYSQVVDPRPAALAGFLEASRPTMTDLLNRLESAGLVVRGRPRGGDGRVVEVTLTPAGAGVGDAYRGVLRRRSEAFGEALAQAVAAATAARFTAEETADGGVVAGRS